MNTFIPNNPNAVALLGTKGELLEVAQNIAPDFELKLVTDRGEFEAEAANKPFDTSRPHEERQVLSSAANKARYANTTTSFEACLPVGSLTNDGKLVTKS